jgi:FtsZ-binding cell division protein ZapB
MICKACKKDHEPGCTVKPKTPLKPKNYGDNACQEFADEIARLQAEIDRRKEKQEQLLEHHQYMHEDYAKLLDENARLKAENDALRCCGSCDSWEFRNYNILFVCCNTKSERYKHDPEPYEGCEHHIPRRKGCGH